MDEKTSLVVEKPATQLAVEFGKAELKLIKDSITPGSTQEEFNLFIYDCQSRGLNPLKKEIYWIRRVLNKKDEQGNWGKEKVATHQVSIDGFRVIAQRSGEYAGQGAPAYGPIVKAFGIDVPEYVDIIVYRKGSERGTTARAYFTEYAQAFSNKLGTMWAKMPRHMLAKCAESLALRKAFPDYLQGLYTNDEMAGADDEGLNVKRAKASVAVKEIEKTLIGAGGPVATAPQIKKFNTCLSELGKLLDWDKDKREAIKKSLTGGKSTKEMKKPQMVQLIDQLDTRIQAENTARNEAEAADKQVEEAKEVFEGEVVEEKKKEEKAK